MGIQIIKLNVVLYLSYLRYECEALCCMLVVGVNFGGITPTGGRAAAGWWYPGYYWGVWPTQLILHYYQICTFVHLAIQFILKILIIQR